MLDKIYEGLKYLIFNSEDRNSQEKALELLLIIHDETSGIIWIDDYRIPVKIYQNAITEMKNGEKIRCIKILREGTELGLREAKELSERISIIEKIPMAKGYEPF